MRRLLKFLAITAGVIVSSLFATAIGVIFFLNPQSSETPSHEAAALALPEAARPPFDPDARARAFAKALLREDFEGWAHGGESFVHWNWKRPVEVEVKAATLIADYDANEVAADEKYKDRTLNVTGTIMEIGKDAFGGVYVSLAGRSPWKTVHSFLSDDAARSAGQLVKGDTLAVVCKGMGMIVGSPVLRDCDYLDSLMSAQTGAIDGDVDWMLYGRPSRRDAEFDRAVAFAYNAGLHLAPDFTCWEDGGLSKDKCRKQLDEKLKEYSKEQQQADYDALSKSLKLPPRSSTSVTK